MQRDASAVERPALIDPFTLCVKERVDIAMNNGSFKRVNAWKFGDLASHRAIGTLPGVELDYYTITHLPTGLSFAQASCCFKRSTDAVSAMLEISRLKNSWAFLDDDDLPKLAAQIRSIAQRNGGGDKPYGRVYARIADAPLLNGYKA